MTAEKQLYQWLVRSAPKEWHMQRIESSTSNGIPDLNVASDGCEWWWELKAGTKFPELRPAQFSWLRRRHLSGGNVGVLHRQSGLPWRLFGLKDPKFEERSGKIRLTGDPVATGFTVESLKSAILQLYGPARTPTS